MKTNRIAFVLLLAAVLFMAAFAYYRTTGSLPPGFLAGHNPDDGSGVKTARLISSFTYQSSDNTSFAIYKNWIMRADREIIRAYTIDGNEAWEIKASPIGRPLMIASDQFLMVADIGGRHLQLYEGSVLRLDIEAENTIINADISASGWITIVHRTSNARNAVSVYRKNGDILFTRYIVERFVTWAKVLDGEESIVVSSLDVAGTTTDNDIEFLDFSGEPAIGMPFKYNDTAFTYMKAFGRDNVLLSDNRKAVCINKDEGEMWSVSFENGGVEYVDIYSDQAAILGSPGQEYHVKLVSRKGVIKEGFKISGNLNKLLLTGKRIVAADGRMLYFMDYKGNILEKHATKTDVKDILSVGSNRFAIITGNRVEVVEI